MKNKKKLLVAVAAMSAFGIAAGTVSTFAWFQTSTAATVRQAGSENTVSINENAGSEIAMDATIHVVIGTGSHVNMPLSTWIDDDPTGDHDWELYTGAYAKGADYTDARLTKISTQADGYTTFPVSAWLEDTSASGEKSADGHEAAWKAAINALQTSSDFTKSFTFSYDSEASGTLLPSADTKFYFEEDNNTVNAIDKALETAANATVSVSAKALLTNYTEYENNGTQPMLQLGYLFVRAEGSARAHTNNSNYVVPLKVAATA